MDLTTQIYSEYVFKQTAKELGVPYFVARHNSDEDLAALSQLLNAPVLATDTMFCAYYLQAGCIPLKFFDWKNVSHFSCANRGVAKNGGTRGGILWWHPLSAKI